MLSMVRANALVSHRTGKGSNDVPPLTLCRDGVLPQQVLKPYEGIVLGMSTPEHLRP